MPLPLLEGEVMSSQDEVIDALNEQISDLNRQVLDAQADAQRARRNNAQAIAALRQQLGPLYRALQQVFGEMDKIGVDEAPAAGNSRVAGVWEKWKQKLPGHQANFISALQDHGEMSAPQLRVAMQCAHQTVYDTAAKLNKLGLLSKNGGKYSLKQL